MKKANLHQPNENSVNFMLAEYGLLKDFRGSILSQTEAVSTFYLLRFQV